MSEYTDESAGGEWVTGVTGEDIWVNADGTIGNPPGEEVWTEMPEGEWPEGSGDFDPGAIFDQGAEDPGSWLEEAGDVAGEIFDDQGGSFEEAADIFDEGGELDVSDFAEDFAEQGSGDGSGDVW